MSDQIQRVFEIPESGPILLDSTDAVTASRLSKPGMMTFFAN